MSLTELWCSVSVATLLDGSRVGVTLALAIPPPAWIAALRVTWLRSSVTVPPKFAIPPPMSADPPVTVRFSRDKLPPGPSTSKTRTVPVPSIVAPLALTVIGVVTTGRPFSPLLSTVVRA